MNSYVGAEEQMIVGSEDVPTGDEPDPVGVIREGGSGPARRTGTLSLFHGDTKVGEATIKTQLGAFAIAGSGLYVGTPRASRSPGTTPASRRTFTGGTLHQVSVNVSGEPYLDLERQAAQMLCSRSAVTRGR